MSFALGSTVTWRQNVAAEQHQAQSWIERGAWVKPGKGFIGSYWGKSWHPRVLSCWSRM